MARKWLVALNCAGIALNSLLAVLDASMGMWWFVAVNVAAGTVCLVCAAWNLRHA